ncbi:MAG: class I SAM-dependent methyltransferase [Bacteroidota bacterium]
MKKIVYFLDAVKIYGHYGLNKKLSALFKDKVVYSGPFKGMVYPDYFSSGSALYSKLVGCYESELHVVIDDFLTNNYDTIIDIGCSEGYYPVGLALRQPQARVYAIDIDEGATIACDKMASLNNVADRVITSNYCNTEILAGMISGKTLIISDCEGYEIELFTESSHKVFSSCDLLIEVHDNVDINISGAMKHVFNATHAIQNYYSMPEHLKFSVQESKYGYEILKSFNSRTQYQAITDLRTSVTEWLICKPLG